jgi:hypothetical protein
MLGSGDGVGDSVGEVVGLGLLEGVGVAMGVIVGNGEPATTAALVLWKRTVSVDPNENSIAAPSAAIPAAARIGLGFSMWAPLSLLATTRSLVPHPGGRYALLDESASECPLDPLR